MKLTCNLTFCAALLALNSCASLASPKGNNTSRAQFLDEVWVSGEYRGKAASEQFSKIHFAKVTTHRLERQGWWQSQSGVKQEQLQSDVSILAGQMDQALVQASRNDPARRLNLAGSPGTDTLTVEIAITELIPAKAYWNASATAAGFVIPGAGFLSTFGSGSVAIEGRLIDGNTGKTIATFRDRMSDKMAAVNIDSYSWYGGSKKNLEEIAVKTVRVLNSDSDTVVTSSSPFTLATF